MDFDFLKKIPKNNHLAVVLASSFGGLAIVRELGRQRIPTVAVGDSEYIGKSRYCVDVEIKSTQEIVRFLRELPHHVSSKPVLLTDNEDHLDLLYEHWDTLSDDYLAPIGADNHRITDKWQLYNNALSAGINAPVTYTRDELNNISQFPVIVKPLNDDKLWQKSGMKYQKVYECHNRMQLNATVQLLEQHEADCVVQQIIPGNVNNLYCVTLYRNRHGKVITGFVVNKLSQYPLEYGTGTIHATCHQADLIAASVKLLNAVNYVGVAMIEFKFDRDRDQFFIIEVNGRFPVETAIVRKLGNQFVYEVYQDLINPSTTTKPYEVPRKQVVWIYFLSYIRSMKQKGIHWFKDLSTLIRRYEIQGALLDWSDPLPALYFPRYLLRRVMDRK